MERSTWDEVFVTMCYTIATRSPDLSTKVGAVIVAEDKSVVSVGYNGLPRGLEITSDRLSSENGLKYLYTEHSERNAIYNAGRNGVPLKGCTLYVNFLPCADCARAIIQAGIIEVVTHKQGHTAFYETRGEKENQWCQAHSMVIDWFEQAGIQHRWFDGKILKPSGFFSGQVIDI